MSHRGLLFAHVRTLLWWRSILSQKLRWGTLCGKFLKNCVPGHFTSMKKELGDWTRRLSLCCLFWCSTEGLRRSTARVYNFCPAELINVYLSLKNYGLPLCVCWAVDSVNKVFEDMSKKFCGRGGLRFLFGPACSCLTQFRYRWRNWT